MLNFEILLDNPRKLYFPGDPVEGKVVRHFDQAETIEGIKVVLSGSEYTTWTEYEPNAKERKKNRRPVHYRGHNDFLLLETVLAEAGDVGVGLKEYPFRFDLPKDVPGTHHVKYGWVKYVLKATIDRPNKGACQEEEEVKVVSLVDFKDIKDQLQLQPVEFAEDIHLCCWCCASGPIAMRVRLEKRAFATGETVKVGVEINNRSREDIDMVGVDIRMDVISRVKMPSPAVRHDDELLALARESGVPKRSRREYSFSLEIPATSGVPNFRRCALFSRRTTLKVTALLPMCHPNLEIPIDIVVGHIPVGSDPDPYYRTILEQTAYLIPDTPPAAAPPEHITLPSRIPCPIPDPNESNPPPLESTPLSPPSFFPNEGGTVETPRITSSSGLESPPPSYDEATHSAT